MLLEIISVIFFDLKWNHLYFFNHFILHKYISVVSFSHCFLKFLECAFILSCYLHYSGLNLPIYLSISSLLIKAPRGPGANGKLGKLLYCSGAVWWVPAIILKRMIWPRERRLICLFNEALVTHFWRHLGDKNLLRERRWYSERNCEEQRRG